MQITIIPGTPIELFSETGLTPGTILAIAVLAGVRVDLSIDNTFANLETIPFNHTEYSADGLATLWVRAPQKTIINVSNPSIISPWKYLEGVGNGTRALITQSYIEANVKNGLQYYIRLNWSLADPILPSTSRYFYLSSGAKTVIIKTRILHYIGEELRLTLFANPTGITGGTVLTPSNYNLKSAIAVPTTVSGVKDPTFTLPGISLDSEPEYYFGANAAGQRNIASIPMERERIIPPNSNFLVELSNTGAGNARAQYYLDWYEGDTDLPLL